MSKEKQPNKLVNQYRGKTLNGELLRADVTIDQNILLHLFDPREKGQTHLIKKLSENSRIELSSDPKREILAAEEFRRLPTVTEFKMFLWIYKQALLQGTRELTFSSSAECLRILGYSNGENNFKLLTDTIFVYMGLDVAFENCYYDLDNKGIQRKNNGVTTFKFFNKYSYIKDKTTKEINSISIIFDESFWKFNAKENKLVKHLDVNKLMQLKSPLAVKLYLYFTQWLGKNKDTGLTEYKRIWKESVSRFFMNLGYETGNLTPQQYRLQLFKLKKAIKEITELDKNMNFTLIEDFYKATNNRQIKFNWERPVSTEVPKLKRPVSTETPTIKRVNLSPTALARLADSVLRSGL